MQSDLERADVNQMTVHAVTRNLRYDDFKVGNEGFFLSSITLQRIVPLKEQIATLIELQNVDLAQEAILSEIEKKSEKAAHDESLLEDLINSLEAQSTQISETQSLQSAKQLELEEAKTGLDSAKAKFNGSTNSRDYAAGEREVENFRKIVQQIEDEITQLQAAIAESTESYDNHKKEFEKLKTEIDQEKLEVEQAREQVSARIGELDAQSKALARKISPQFLARYRFIRSRRPGLAVVPAVQGNCSGCHMKLPPQLFIQVQKQSTMECCQNCQRILYFDEQSQHDNH